MLTLWLRRTYWLHLGGRCQEARPARVVGRESESLRVRYVRLVCIAHRLWLMSRVLLGPPGQVAAVAGKKAGMKQGELGGILKELGYTEDQVCGAILLMCARG